MTLKADHYYGPDATGYEAKRAPKWFPDWRGQTVVVVGAGPSAAETDLELARGRARVVTVNNSIRLAPWADMAYGCDARWWIREGGLPGFKGLKVSSDWALSGNPHGVKLVRAVRGQDVLLMAAPGIVGWFGNGGTQAINLAAQAGAGRIILVGFEMSYAWGEHWHDPHPWELPAKTANVERHRRVTDGIVPPLRAHGIEPVNATPRSALKDWPRMTLADALA